MAQGRCKRAGASARSAGGFVKLMRIDSDVWVLLEQFSHSGPRPGLVPDEGMIGLYFGLSGYERSVTVLMQPLFFLDTFLSPWNVVPDTLRSLLTPLGPHGPLHSVPLNQHMLQIIARLFETRMGGKLASIQARALTVQLLCAALTAMAEPKPRAHEISSTSPSATRH